MSLGETCIFLAIALPAGSFVVALLICRRWASQDRRRRMRLAADPFASTHAERGRPWRS